MTRKEHKETLIFNFFVAQFLNPPGLCNLLDRMAPVMTGKRGCDAPKKCNPLLYRHFFHNVSLWKKKMGHSDTITWFDYMVHGFLGAYTPHKTFSGV